MVLFNSSKDWPALIAAAAELCLKPWKYAVIDKNNSFSEEFDEDVHIDCIIRIECRSIDGERYPENDIELEIYSSGSDLNLMLSWPNKNEKPILWHGNHSVWMDPNIGNRCPAPEDAKPFEALARRLRSIFVLVNDI